MTRCAKVILLMLLLALGPVAAEVNEPLAPGDHTFTVTVDRLERNYILYVPKGCDGAKALPVVLMLHGGGGDAKGTSRRYGWREKADAEGFFAVFPEATPLFAKRPARFRDNPRVWNDASARGLFPGRRPDDVGYIRAVLDDVAKRLRVDEDRVYCTGFSNGASMTWHLAVELSDRLAAAAPVSGHFWLDDGKPARHIPILFMTGAADPLNPLKGGKTKTPWGREAQKPPMQRSIDRWVKMIVAKDEPKVLRDEDGVRTVRYGPGKEGTHLTFTTIEGLGHVWPGSRRVLPRVWVGDGSNKLNATDVIWEFFRQHRRGDAAGMEKKPGAGARHGWWRRHSVSASWQARMPAPPFTKLIEVSEMAPASESLNQPQRRWRL